MEGVKLMNRTDTKYCIPAELLTQLLEEIKADYKCVEIENKRICTYKTLYYDTEAMLLYHQHHSGKLNRYKIRRRNYVDSGISFLEVKFKNNKGRTVKDRIKDKEDHSTQLGEKSLNFLHQELPFDPLSLVPVLWVNYGRITLVSKTSSERVTIDTNLEFVKEEKKISMKEMVIIEVKQEKKKSSAIIESLKKHRVHEGGISKYCLAAALTCEGVKINNFKEKIHTLKKLNKHDIASNSSRRADQ